MDFPVVSSDGWLVLLGRNFHYALRADFVGKHLHYYVPDLGEGKVLLYIAKSKKS